jgi:hypothetical protein
MNNLSTYNILCVSFYFSILLGTLMNFMEKPEYSFPPNMGWIVMLGLLTILNKDNK